MSSFELLSFKSPEDLARSVAGRWLDELAVIETPCHAALSGGRIARNFFQAVASGARARLLAFDPVLFFWADERCVPPDDPESNFKLASEHLLKPLNIPPAHCHRIQGELEPREAAAEAEMEIRGIVPSNADGAPVLDWIFLGMGEDGHVASLFPEAGLEGVTTRSVFIPVVASKPPPHRISISYGAIAAARNVWVLASGKGKEDALRESSSRDGKTPLAHVLRSRRSTLIFSDL